MKWSGTGLCTIFSSTLLFVCAVSEVAVGLRCVALGSAVRAHFRLGAAAGAFYSGILVGIGQGFLGMALLCCTGKPGCRNFLLLGVVVFLLGVLTAFSGAVVDGDTVSLVERKYSHYCLHPPAVAGSPACGQLKDYQRSLVVSTVLSTLECLLGLLHLLFIRRYKSAQFYRNREALQRQSAGAILYQEERDFSSSASDLQPVSYINLGVFNVLEETRAEAHCRGHPSLELPGYSCADPELNLSYPFSYPLPPSERPPAYEDIFPPAAASCNM